MAPATSKKGGDLVRTEPSTLSLLNSSPAIRLAFENTWCIPFCQNIQKVGHNAKLARLFALNFQESRVKLGYLEIILTEKFIANATNLPTIGEKWFKGDELDIVAYKQFVNPEYLDSFASTFPKIYLQEKYIDLLKVIKTYFTCKGRFSRIY